MTSIFREGFFYRKGGVLIFRDEVLGKIFRILLFSGEGKTFSSTFFFVGKTCISHFQHWLEDQPTVILSPTFLSLHEIFVVRFQIIKLARIFPKYLIFSGFFLFLCGWRQRKGEIRINKVFLARCLSFWRYLSAREINWLCWSVYNIFPPLHSLQV